MSPPHREAADRRHQLPAVRAAGRGGEPDLQGHCFPQTLCPLECRRDGESWGGCWVQAVVFQRGCTLPRALNPSLPPPPQAHEYVENQHIASNLTVRVNHDLLQAGAICRVSNALGVSEKHIQLLGESRALPSAPETWRSISPPRTGTVCAVLPWRG